MKTLTLTIAVLFLSLVGFSQSSSIFQSDLYKGSTYSTPKVNTQISTTNSSVRYQSGYVKSDGTWVQPHYKTQSNSTNHDNFSTTPNVNPFTGTSGTKARDYSSEAYNYGSGKVIHTGPRGGQYYYNSNGNKTYVPKRW